MLCLHLGVVCGVYYSYIYTFPRSLQSCLGAYKLVLTGAAHVAVHLVDGLLVLGLVRIRAAGRL